MSRIVYLAPDGTETTLYERKVKTMSDTMDDVRSHIAEQRHERGECDSNCWYCNEPETCAICGEPIELEVASESHNLCKACWRFEVVGFDA